MQVSECILKSMKRVKMRNRLIGSHPHGCIAGLKGEKMAVKILITQALDERDLLVKKINNKIEKTSFRYYESKRGTWMGVWRKMSTQIW